MKKKCSLDFGKHSGERFEFSLVFLIAALLMSIFILLFSLIRNQNSQIAAQAFPNLPGAFQGNGDYSRSPLLEDENLEFTLKIPAQLGEWVYKTGFVKSPVDEALSNQYMTIFVPQNAKEKTNNLDDLTQDILTVRQYSETEWEKLESGCQKGNQFYCEIAGEKIGEKDGKVYASTKPGKCSETEKSKCALAEKIIQGFELK